MSILFVREGDNAGKEFPLPDGGEIKIGRAPGLAVTILDAKASREHCRLFHQATGWIVEDLGSRNGTWVNAQRVKKRLLQPGDRLRVGRTEFEFLKVTAAATKTTTDLPDAPAVPVLRSTKKPR